MRIDLHAHSTVSDGTNAPRELVALADQAGLDVIALTDHDSTLGWDEAAQAAQTCGIGLVRGTEFSTTWQGQSLHLLSYLHRPDDAELVNQMTLTVQSRRQRIELMVERLASNFPIYFDQVMAQAGPDTTLGRPHIADALVALGAFPDRSAAFATVLAPESPYYVRHYACETVTMIKYIRAAGGVPVLAHPGMTKRNQSVSDDAIRIFTESGLAGLEIDHRDNPPEQRHRLAKLADQLGLLKTGSSDYHGAGKPNRLGENLTVLEVLEEIVVQARDCELG